MVVDSGLHRLGLWLFARPSPTPGDVGGHTAAWRRSAAVVAGLLLVGLLGGQPSQAYAQPHAPATHQAPADTGQTARAQNASSRPTPWVNLHPDLLSVWGPTTGWGFGLGVSVRHLLTPGSRLFATVRPAQDEGRYSLAFATGDLQTASRYLLVRTQLRRTANQWYYGVGPQTRADQRLAVALTAAAVGVQVGQRLWGERLLVQPRVAVHYDAPTRFRDVTPGAFAVLDARSQRALQASVGGRPDGPPRRLPGLRYGLDVAFDLRDRAFRPTRGFYLHAGGTRYRGLRTPAPRYTRLTGELAAFVPVFTDRVVAAVRSQLTVTAPAGDTPLPFYLLTRLGARDLPGFARQRFFGRDAFLMGAELRVELFRAWEVLTVDGILGAQAGSVYNAIEEQFALRVSRTERITASANGRVPLRPVATVGLRVAPDFRDESYLSVAAGLSAEGISAVRFTFTRPLRTLGFARP